MSPADPSDPEVRDPLLPPLKSKAARRAPSRSKPQQGPSKGPPTQEHLGRYFAIGAIAILAAFSFFIWWGKAHAAAPDDYNFFRFAKVGEFWYTQVEVEGRPLNIPFYSHPRDLAGIPVDPAAAEKVLALRGNAGRLIVALDPDAGGVPVKAGVQISRLTGSRYQVFNIPTSSALTRPEPNTTIPVMTCANATPTTVVLQIRLSGRNVVSAQGDCVLLEAASADDSIRVAERFGYALLGVMQ